MGEAEDDGNDEVMCRGLLGTTMDYGKKGIGKCVTWCMNTTWNHGKKGIFDTASDHGRVRELVKQGRGRVMYSGLVGIQGLMGRREFWTLQRIVSEVEGYGNDEVM